MEIFSTGIGIFAFIVGLIWLFFPFAVINFFSKQRAANRLIVQHLEAMDLIVPRLEAIDRELQEMKKRMAPRIRCLPTSIVPCNGLLIAKPSGRENLFHNERAYPS